MPPSDSHVKFDRNGISYVDYDHLRSSPKVHRQLEAARRLMAQQETRRSGVHTSGSHTAATLGARRTKR